MKKGIIFVLLIIFLVFASARIIFAVGPMRSPFGSGQILSGIFGGKIIATKAYEIQELEDFGYTCDPGTSIEILPVGSPVGIPTSYFIPSGVMSKTGTIPRAGQFIMGRYLGKTMVTCVQTSDGVVDVQTIDLDRINLFGTSR